MKSNKPILLATLGFPGSGKTYFARRFAKEQGFFHLSSDIVRGKLYPKPKYSAAENRVIFGLMDELAEILLKSGKSVIYDANTNLREYRRKYRDLAKRVGAGYFTLYIETSVRTALARLEKRRKLRSARERAYHRPIDNDVLFRLRKEMELPARGEPTIRVDGERPYRAQAKEVFRKLK